MRPIKFMAPVYVRQEQTEGDDKVICIGVFPVRGWWDAVAIEKDDIKKGVEKYFPGFYYDGDGTFRNDEMEDDIVENTISIEGFREDSEWDDIVLEGCEMLQFIGLLDKNGKEIYEGDIVSTGKEDWQEDLDCNHEVFWGEKELMFGFRTEDGKHAGSLTFWIDNEHKPIEVVGNIYENPELLGRFHYTKLQSNKQ